jgi:hypothetical protein
MKTTSSNGAGLVNNIPNSHAQQHFHNHNASLGRIPPNAINNRHSREMSNGSDATTALRDVQGSGYPSIQSALQASAPSFGPSSQASSQAQSSSATASPTTVTYGGSMGSYYNNNTNNNGNYNMQMMAMGMQNMHLNQQMYAPANPYASYGVFPQNGGRDSQARVIQQRRQNDGEGMSTTPCEISNY